MNGYLGETIVDIKDTPYKYYTESDWVSFYITRYGSIQGEHHKTWVLDQIARLTKGTEVEVSIARWELGDFEYRVNLKEPSEEYIKWVQEIEEGGHIYDEGIAP